MGQASTDGEPGPRFVCACGYHLGEMRGRYLVVFRLAVPASFTGAAVTKLAQPAPILCSNCQREKWFRPVPPDDNVRSIDAGLKLAYTYRNP